MGITVDCAKRMIYIRFISAPFSVCWVTITPELLTPPHLFERTVASSLDNCEYFYFSITEIRFHILRILHEFIEEHILNIATFPHFNNKFSLELDSRVRVDNAAVKFREGIGNT